MPKHTAMKCLPTPQSLAGMTKDTPVLVALSGGADSAALLHLTVQQGKRHGFAVFAAHLNHGIRGEEAERDLDFCRRLAAEYGIGFFSETANIPALAAKRGTSLEQEAREVRYAFLQKVMREQNIPLLVTAHHADDQLETVLFRMCRGTGSDGLCGIAPVRDLGRGHRLVRPLLRVTRRQILQYCTEQNLSYVTDSTNADTAYARNRLRAEVVPVLETLFADPQLRVASLVADLREDASYLTQTADRFLRKHMTDGTLPVDALRELPPPVFRRVLSAWLCHAVGHDCERVHKDDIRTCLIEAQHPRAEVALPGEWVAEVVRGRLCVRPRAQESAPVPFRLPFFEGVAVTPDEKYFISVQKTDENTKINNLSTQSYIILHSEFDIINSSLHWRSLREGDVLLRGGMHKRLRRLFREAELPAHERFRIPLLCDDAGVLWAPLVGARDGLPSVGDAYLIRVWENDISQE